jgi:hypothetical protein
LPLWRGCDVAKQGGSGGGLQEAQAQLLADVEASRLRGRDAVLRQQLREALVGRQALRPALGAPLLFELEVVNTSGRPQVGP